MKITLKLEERMLFLTIIVSCRQLLLPAIKAGYRTDTMTPKSLLEEQRAFVTYYDEIGLTESVQRIQKLIENACQNYTDDSRVPVYTIMPEPTDWKKFKRFISSITDFADRYIIALNDDKQKLNVYLSEFEKLHAKMIKVTEVNFAIPDLFVVEHLSGAWLNMYNIATRIHNIRLDVYAAILREEVILAAASHYEDAVVMSSNYAAQFNVIDINLIPQDPDKLEKLTESYLQKLSKISGIPIEKIMEIEPGVIINALKNLTFPGVPTVLCGECEIPVWIPNLTISPYNKGSN
jgi:hypothetical protein